MALDMYAWIVPAGSVLGEQDTDVHLVESQGQEQVPIQLYFWRSHHQLHGWMEKLYRAKGGRRERFNCCTLRLRETDLDTLEEAVRSHSLPPREGFFFLGETAPDAQSDRHDLQFIENARRAIRDGYAVFYDSWW